MVQAELRGIHSPDLAEPALPRDPENCVVLIQAMVGPKGEQGEESFDFEVVANSHQTLESARGRVVVERFDWSRVRAIVTEGVERARGRSWAEVAELLNKQWCWEFDNYQDFTE